MLVGVCEKEKCVMRDVFENKLCLVDVLDKYACEERLRRLALDCICMLALSCPRRMSECLAILINNTKYCERFDEYVLRDMLDKYMDVYVRYGEMVDVLMNDDVGKFVEMGVCCEWMFGMSERMMHDYSICFGDCRLGWLVVLFGCERIFRYVESVVDIDVSGLSDACNEIACLFAVMSDNMYIANRLVGYGVDFSKCDVCNVRMMGCSDEMLEWLLGMVNGRCVMSPEQLCVLCNCYRMGFADQHDVDQRIPHEKLYRICRGRWFNSSVCGLVVFANKSHCTSSELAELYASVLGKCVRLADCAFLQCMDELVGLDVCSVCVSEMCCMYKVRSGCAGRFRKYSLVEYMIVRGCDVLIDKFNIDVGALGLDSRCMLLLSRSEKLFRRGLEMRDVCSMGCVNELCYYINYVRRDCIGCVDRVVMVVDSVMKWNGSSDAHAVLDALRSVFMRVGNGVELYNEVCERVLNK